MSTFIEKGAMISIYKKRWRILTMKNILTWIAHCAMATVMREVFVVMREITMMTWCCNANMMTVDDYDSNGDLVMPIWHFLGSGGPFSDSAKLHRFTLEDDRCIREGSKNLFTSVKGDPPPFMDGFRKKVFGTIPNQW